MSSTLQNTFIIIGILLIAGLGYYLYTQNNVISLNRTSSSNQQVSIESAQFLNDLQQLRTIHVNDTVFSNPRFQVLTNLSVPVVPSYIGKTNPFQMGG